MMMIPVWLAWVVVQEALAVSFSVSNYSCPTWLYYSNTSHACECGVSFISIICHQDTMEVEVWAAYCVTFSGEDGTFYAGYCPYSYYNSNQSNGLYSVLPTDPDQLNDKMCGPYNRKGLLCGECIDGYGPGVYTLDRKCVDCSKFSMGSAICLYLLVEFVPILLFFLCVTIFRLDLTSGPMLGYVIFCQIISYGFESIPVKEYDSIVHSRVPFLASVLLSITEFWNLNILKTVIPPFCISDRLTEMHVIVLKLVSTIYPLLIAITSLLLIHLHSRQNRTIVILFKPLSFVLKLTNGKAITSDSVIHTFASFLFLSSTKTFFVFTSVIKSVPVITNIDGSTYKLVLFADASIEYYSCEHILYMLLALIQCLFLVFLPSLLLFLYPTRLYRWISQFISARKRLAITTFVEALNHCFKDGLNGTRDYRALAGLLIVGVPIVCLLVWVLAYTVVSFTLVTVSFIAFHFSLAVSYCQPFKSTVANMSVSFYCILFGGGPLIYYYMWKFRGSSLEMISTFILPLSQAPVAVWALYNLVRYIQKRNFKIFQAERNDQ